MAAKVIQSEGQEPRFTHLVQFIDKKATEATSRFGSLASAKLERDRDARNKFKSKQADYSSIKATTLATKSMPVQPVIAQKDLVSSRTLCLLLQL